MFDPIFKALLNEATFTNELLGSGVTQIRKANYASKGIYAQSFSNLSTGLERIGKLCLILNYYIENNGQFPEEKLVKDKYGHNLTKLYIESQQVVKDRNISFDFFQDLSSDIHQAVIKVLTDFAKGDRYCNINLITRSRDQNDPIARWFELVDCPIWDTHISSSKKQEIEDKALFFAAFMTITGQHSATAYLSETGEDILDPGEASFRTGIFKAVAPFRQLYILQIIRYWVEMLLQLRSQAEALGQHKMPDFWEIFVLFNNSDKYFRSRKTWLKRGAAPEI